MSFFVAFFFLLLRETVALDYEDLRAGGGYRRTMECSLMLYYVASFSFYLSILFQDNNRKERDDEKCESRFVSNIAKLQ